MRWVLVAFLLSLVATGAFAALSLTGAGDTKSPVSTAASYTGPGNVVSGASGWWGFRAYNAAYATGSNNAINIRRTSDNTTSNIVILSNGNLDTATASTFCNATSCFLTEAYDQSGNARHQSQATAANQPQLKFNCIGSLPCMQFTGALFLGSATIPALTQPITYSVVAERTSNVAFDSLLSAFAGSAGAVMQGNSTSANSWRGYAGNAVPFSPSDNAAHNVQMVFNGTGGAVNLDGTDTTSVNYGTQAGQTGIAIGSDVSGGGGGHWNGYAMELGYWNNLGFSSTQRGNVCHNQFTYWGTATSC